MLPGTKVIRWTDADISFLKQKNDVLTYAEIAQVLGRTQEAVQTKAMEIGVKKSAEFVEQRSAKTQFKPGNVPSPRAATAKRRQRNDGWTDHEISTLRNNWETATAADIAAMLGTRTASSVKTKALELGIKKSKEARRLLSHRYNTGQFTKGIRPANEIPNGTITTRTDKNGNGYKWIKLGFKNWQQLSHYNWLNAGNVIPAGYLITFKDNNPLNCELDNLLCVRRGHHQMEEPELAEERKARQQAYKLAQRQKRYEARLEQRKLSRAAKRAERGPTIKQLADEARERKAIARELRMQDKLAAKEERKKQRELLSMQKQLQKAKVRDAERNPAPAKPTKEKQPVTPAKAFVSSVPSPAISVSTKRLIEKHRKAQEEQNALAAKCADDIAKAKLLRAELKRKAKAEKERQRLAEEAEAKRKFETRPFDPTGKIKLKIRPGLEVWIRPDQDPDAVRAKYGVKPAIPKDEKPWPDIPVPVYQF